MSAQNKLLAAELKEKHRFNSSLCSHVFHCLHHCDVDVSSCVSSGTWKLLLTHHDEDCGRI